MPYSFKILALTAIALPLLALPLAAQPPGGPRGGPPPNPKVAAPIDLTGYWVSIVTEDWRYRMVTPAPGDYQSVPMTQAAVKIADAWDPAKDEAAGELCKSYGAPAILRVPEHLHITWQDDHTLHMDTDSGKQTRVFHFGDWKAPEGPATLQGDSVAEWQMQRTSGPPLGPAPKPAKDSLSGSLKVSTSHFKAGFLRKNGVPYSENASIVEYYDLVRLPGGNPLMVVTVVTTDPLFLREPFIVSSHFRKQADDTGWKPTECSAKW
jgi:hypothetical protein